MNVKAFVDSNIFLYAFTDKDLGKHTIAKEIILNNQCNISVQVINEVSNNLLKKLKFNESEIENFIDACYARYSIEPLSKAVLITASQLRGKYCFSYYDSLIVSSALISQSEILYTEDMQHLQLIENKIQIINPFIKN